MSAPVNADPYRHPWELSSVPEKTFRIAPELRFYSTESNYDRNGGEIQPTSLEKVTRVSVDAPLAYQPVSGLTLFGRLSWERVQAEHSTLGGESYGLTDQAIGLSYRLFTSDEFMPGKTDRDTLRVELHAQASVEFPLYDNDTAVSEGRPQLGNQTTAFTAGGFATLELPNGPRSAWTLTGGAGYTGRSDDFSPLLSWSLRFGLEKLEGFVFSGMIYGVHSLQNTALASSAGNPCALAGVAGSCLSGSDEPSLLAVRGRVGYWVSPALAFEASLTPSLSGKAAPKGTDLAVNVTFLLGQANMPTAGSARKDPEKYQKSNQGFVDYGGITATVTKVNDRMGLVKIDRGSEESIKIGDIFDIFSVKSDGTIAETIARAKVESVKAGEAALKISEYFKEVWIEEGFLVKRPLQ